MRKELLLVFGLLLTPLPTVSAQPNEGRVRITVHPETVTLERKGRMLYPQTGRVEENPGSPQIPLGRVEVEVPSDVIITRIEVASIEQRSRVVSRGLSLAPVGRIMEYGSDDDRQEGVVLDRWGRNVELYERQGSQPDPLATIVSRGHRRSTQLFTLEYALLAYFPTQNHTIRQIDELVVELRFLRADEAPPVPVQQTRTPGYAIITSAAVVKGSLSLSDFVDHKRAMGFNVHVETIEEIHALYPDLSDRADRIRRWLQDRYLVRNIEYVLLIGNPHPETGRVPMKATWPKSRTTPVPTDQYYAELTEDWNANGNHRVGEFSDDIDLTPEVYVGRIPFDRVSRVDRVLRKTIAYDIATEQGGPAIAWRRNVLLPMSRMDSNTDGAFLGVHMVNHYLIENGFRPLTLFQDHEQPRLGFHADMELTSGCVPELWSRNAFGMVWWEAHGSSTGASIWRSGTLINNHLIEQVHPLPEDRPAIVFSASCNNARAERYSLASSLIRTGAIAVIAATRPSHYLVGQRFRFHRTGAASPTIAYNVGKLLVKHRMAVGKALYEYKGRIHPNKSLWFKNTLVYNLYGDPSIRLHKEPLFGENPTTSPTADAPRPDTVNGRGKSKPITPRIEWFRN